jgi:hypothetical protein
MAAGAGAQLSHEVIKEAVKGAPKGPEEQRPVCYLHCCIFVDVVAAAAAASVSPIHRRHIPAVHNDTWIELLVLPIVPVPDITDVSRDHGKRDAPQQDNKSFPCLNRVQGVVEAGPKDDVVVAHPLDPVLLPRVIWEVERPLGEEWDEDLVSRPKGILRRRSHRLQYGFFSLIRNMLAASK